MGGRLPVCEGLYHAAQDRSQLCPLSPSHQGREMPLAGVEPSVSQPLPGCTALGFGP